MVVILLFYPIQFILLQNESYFSTGFKLIRIQAQLILFFVGIRPDVKGVIPDDENTTYIICPNHSSYLDILLMYAALPNYFIFLGKKELGSVPIFNIYFKKMNILVDRGNPKAAHESLTKACAELNKGSNLVIFPEGTIPRSVPKMKAFKNGAFKTALQLNIPIVPVTFKDNYKLLEDNWSFFSKTRPGKARVFIHPPIHINKEEPQDLLTLREQTKAKIASQLD